MTARRLLGEPIAAKLRDEVKELASRGPRPRLLVVASAEESARIYARRIVKDAESTGIEAVVAELGAAATTEDAVARVESAARDRSVHAILLQTPLPAGIDAPCVASAIPAHKDVDGASPASAGAVALGRSGAFFPATAAAVLEILERSGAPVAGARALVIGRSAVVGRPAALGLVARDATVTIAHSKTRDLAALAREAEVLVVAVGKPALVEASWVRPGATVIDVGVHRVDEAAARRLYADDPERLAAIEQKRSALVGDCHPGVERVAGAFTPVPGGVGPVTTAILLRHVARAARA
ncbi:MAG TPA: bifunctional 5,10-methylenetetrahydrofolate dehydrogenase/5,10-methenyltetrahydrofolate cyclohydrolase [Planctomycetota bacterium]|nr:bifunctional 5,10-methylenetetrahydrofolate dehydrogenase/5,10-methenyltetrahydrofolate cyclohydrolase [Planctomycetota bacterium]